MRVVPTFRPHSDVSLLWLQDSDHCELTIGFYGDLSLVTYRGTGSRDAKISVPVTLMPGPDIRTWRDKPYIAPWISCTNPILINRTRGVRTLALASVPLIQGSIAPHLFRISP